MRWDAPRGGGHKASTAWLELGSIYFDVEVTESVIRNVEPFVVYHKLKLRVGPLLSEATEQDERYANICA